MSHETLKNTHSNFNSLRIKMGRTPSSQDFMSFARRINNRHAVETTHNFLKELQHFKKSGLITELTETVKDVKTFLSAYMIIDNKEDIFSVIGNKEELLYKAAVDMISSFEKLCLIIHDQTSDELIDNEPLHSTLDKFHDHHRLYVAAFDAWKSDDLTRLITVLSHSYHELRLTQATIVANATQEDRELREDEVLWSNEIDKQCDSIRSKIEKIGGVEATAQLDAVPTSVEESEEVEGEEGEEEGQPQMINLDSIIEEVKASEEGKEAMARDYWNEFAKQIAENNFDRLYELLQEVNNRLCAIVPNRVDIHEQIRSALDVPFIKRQITAGVFDGDQFHTLISFIVEKLKQFGQPVADEAVDNWYDQYLSGITDSTSYSELLPLFFNEVLRRLDQIEESIQAFRRATSSSS